MLNKINGPFLCKIQTCNLENLGAVLNVRLIGNCHPVFKMFKNWNFENGIYYIYNPVFTSNQGILPIQEF